MSGFSLALKWTILLGVQSVISMDLSTWASGVGPATCLEGFGLVVTGLATSHRCATHFSAAQTGRHTELGACSIKLKYTGVFLALVRLFAQPGSPTMKHPHIRRPLKQGVAETKTRSGTPLGSKSLLLHGASLLGACTWCMAKGPDLTP